MNEQKEISLVCSADGHYAPFIAAMLVSVLENVGADYAVKIKILDDGLSEEDQKKTIGSLKKYGTQPEFVLLPPAKTAVFENAASAGSHLPRAAYYRLLAPEIFSDLDKIIYLDGDLVARGDISRLWEMDLGNKSVLAAAVPFRFYYDLMAANFRLPAEQGFFNSGVMVMDLARMRKNNFCAKAIDFIQKNQGRLPFADQDVLNALLFNDCQKMPLAWNATMELYIGRGYPDTAAGIFGFYSKEEFLAAKRDPQIVHFDGALKPWHIGFSHPFKKLFLSYLDKTEFRDYKKKFNCPRWAGFYGYYLLKLLPGFLYQMILPKLKKMYLAKYL